MNSKSSGFDVIIVGSGVSGSFMAWKLVNEGVKCLMLEAGSYFHHNNYPTSEIDSNSKLYWGGGIELNTNADIGILRPKVVGGGSIVNQALLDRFDNIAFDSWKEQSGVEFFNRKHLDDYYNIVAEQVYSQEIPARFRNRNALIFQEGFEKNGYKCAPLVRAQKDCRYEDGNDCIECLGGCRIDSKQSMPVTVLKKAVEQGLTVIPDFEVLHVEATNEKCHVRGKFTNGETADFSGKKLILAAGAIGNPRLLLHSGFKHPMIGRNFFTHPQHMVMALYNEPIDAHKGAFQSFKSDDPNFRKMGFKLENVFAGPVGIAMLVPHFGEKHHRLMRKMNHLACIEVAVRDTNPGRISINKKGRPVIHKSMNKEDYRRWSDGMKAINNIFKSTGATEIIPGNIPIGLHMMGGCGLGIDPKKAVVSPEFKMYENENIFIADSSIFPNAPGINPSFTIMALSVKATESVLKQL
ncbi:MAG TPA: GMC family oxidoreductase, partial [Draconibacterium sp.]|nr:GMC family oxidoreductase [Draconibacterium sp.]